jgi:hypothetical protein
MSTLTSNIKLVKSAGNEAADINVINSNMDLIDQALKSNADETASNSTSIANLAGVGRTTETVKDVNDALVSHGAVSASASAIGHIELATIAETITGTDTQRATTPAGVKAVGDTRSPLRFTSSTITGSTTLALANANTRIFANSASAIIITVPTNATVAFAIGDEVEIINMGTGAVTFVAQSGAVVRSSDGKLAMDGRYAAVSIIKIDTEEWLLIGSLI